MSLLLEILTLICFCFSLALAYIVGFVMGAASVQKQLRLLADKAAGFAKGLMKGAQA